MGEYTKWSKCKCSNNKSCVKKDSEDTCIKTRKRPVAKKGKHGGVTDCKTELDEKDCTVVCKYINMIK